MTSQDPSAPPALPTSDSGIPYVRIAEDVQMPMLGLGVFQSTPEETERAVRVALELGYRSIDTAAIYMNEREVGAGLRASGVPREHVFLTTKLWVTDYGARSARAGFERSLERLAVDYVDLYLLHWPMPADFSRTIESYECLESLRDEGLVRAIGVCNFNPDHLEALAVRTATRPAVNQVELHPYFTQHEVRESNRRHRCLTQAWSPIGGAFHRHSETTVHPGTTSPLDHPVVVAIAEKYDKTPAQVVLRWHVELGVSPIPKSVRPARLAENLAITDFALTAAEVAAIEALDTGHRAGRDPVTFTTADYDVDVSAQ